ncbi:MAG: UDP-N-acetylmuramoyl-L-alanyl-D-glutamate--2,6-diaminopimelate ligase [Microthrixaceae bacterium]
MAEGAGARVPSGAVLGELAAALGGELRGDASVRVSGATHDSRKVKPGWLFCAVEGELHDGIDFVDAAERAGATAVLAQRAPLTGLPFVLVDDVRCAMAEAAALIHGKPADALRIVGITGTNGKTTVASILGGLLTHHGSRTRVLGTLSGARTTPESTDLQEQLAAFVQDGTTHVVMEVSSHALSLHRVDGITFEVGVFTNLGSDHLDFHGNPEAYFQAKAGLFDAGRCVHAVLNIDDVHGRLLADAVEMPVSGFSVDAIEDLTTDSSGSRFTWRSQAVHLPLPGRHNVANALAAAESAAALGMGVEEIVAGLSAAEAVPGRFEVVRAMSDQVTVVVDYAHTPDALQNALDAARGLVDPGGSLAVVFGCGGDRDRDKRPAMGSVATRGADRVVLTDDNPRSEDPVGIIEDILRGCDDSVVVQHDRRAAIHMAVSGAGAGDVVLIAGKGHETTQQYGDRVERFDDRVVVAEELRRLGGQR